MKSLNRPLLLTVLTVGLLVGLISGCSQFGSAPNAFEQVVFTTITNYQDVVTMKTNTVQELVQRWETNQVGQIVSVTNFETVTLFRYETNKQPVYDHVVSDAAKADVAVVGTAVNTFFPGFGGLVSTGLMGILAGWAQYRSSKRGRTSETLSQEVQTLLEFIKLLPNGPGYKEAITKWLQEHQVEQDVASQVLGLISKHVDKDEAKDAVVEIQKHLEAMRKVTAPVPSPTPSVPPA